MQRQAHGLLETLRPEVRRDPASPAGRLALAAAAERDGDEGEAREADRNVMDVEVEPRRDLRGRLSRDPLRRTGPADSEARIV